MTFTQATVRVLVLHSSAEFYGSDKSLLDFVSRRPEGMLLTVALPETGPLVAALEAAGAEVVIGEVCKLQRGMFSPKGVWCTTVAAWRAVCWLRALHRGRRFDLVYSNSVAVLGGALVARSLGLPHVWHVREILIGTKALTWGFRGLVSSMASRVVCNSAETRRWIAGTPRASDPRYAVVWNGVEQSRCSADRRQTRKELGADEGDVLLVLVGRINAWKGQRLLVEAFSRLVAGGVNQARLAIVGSAFVGQEHFEIELEQAVEASGCAERIRVLPFRADVEAIWGAADVVVVPSIEPEPFGRVAIEAMAFSKPVVAAAHGGLKEIVDHGVTGWLVPPRDATSLAAALQHLIVSPMLRENMGRAGLARQQLHFSVQAYADRVAAELNAALEPH